jgi:phosphatidate cytidylyltransferase
VLTVAAVWMGGWFFGGLLVASLLIGLWEFLRMSREAGYPALVVTGVAAGAVLGFCVLTHRETLAGGLLTAVGAAAALQALRPPHERRVAGLALTVFGVAYVMGLGLHMAWLRALPEGRSLLIAVLAGTWAADTGAFFIGVRFGKTPLAPRVSPHKSVEGLVGGIAAALLVTAGLLRWLVPGLGWVPSVILGLAVGCVSPVGDLLESQIKRNLRVKDASSLIPGHGGMLDRIDSSLLSVPVAYYLLRIALKLMDPRFAP